MVSKYTPGLFSQMLTVEDIERPQIKMSITQLWSLYLNRVLHNKILKGGIAACYETWFYEYP